MNGKVLKILEFDKVIAMLEKEASSEPGRLLCRNLEPISDKETIEKYQQQTSDAFDIIIKKGSVSFGNNKDISHILKSLKIASSLNVTELLVVSGLLRNVSNVRSHIGSVEDDSTLKEYFDMLFPLKELGENIDRCIISEEEISDDASPALKAVRRSIGLTGEKIHSHLTKMLNGSMRTYLQDAVITQRDGRYCIPVKAEYKSSVKGMIHDQSSTGSTFFIEPEAVVNLNNELKELFLKEKEEIEKVLEELSAECALHIEEIESDQKSMTMLDFIFARGSLALLMNATRPVFNEKGRIKIRKGRHPLIDPKKVVPIDIHLGGEFDLLVITGPNTGGKTVTLKTVGLLTLMGLSGLHIPALDRSELSIFKKVFADIGDEQSIEQSLSTFSSHMKNIVTILKYANEDSLCLFDELGAGTDPTEGAALAIAILDHLHKRGIKTMATTHYSELKVYALSTVGVENACCEFDVETLSPTYRLLIGIPGKSNAFAISEKLGLPKKIIEEAGKQIDVSQKDFEDLITDLETSRVQIEKDREEVAEYKQRIKELQDNLHNKNEKIDTRRENIIRQANAEARQILEDAKKTADETIRIFREAGPGATMSDLERERDNIRRKINEKDSDLKLKSEAVSTKNALKAEDIKVGDPVRIVTMGMEGVVSTLPDSKGMLYVMCGSLRTKTSVSNLARSYGAEDKDKSKYPTRAVSTKKSSQAKAYSISSEINLLGKTVDEALTELDKYLDDAFLAHLNTVRVVHGKGTGTLRSAVQRYLKKSGYVKEFRLGEYGEGDAGVTIVTFKD